MIKGWLTDDYKEYLESDEWKHKREAKLRQQPYCARLDDFKYIRVRGELRKKKVCGGSLQVHHKHYRTLYDESLDDLEVLCEIHHRLEDEKRTMETRRARAFQTYAEKRHYEGWIDYADEYQLEQLEEDFDRWIESKQ